MRAFLLTLLPLILSMCVPIPTPVNLAPVTQPTTIKAR